MSLEQIIVLAVVQGITEFLLLGFQRPDCARFSPSCSASPATAGAIAFTIGDAFANGGHITSDELLAAGLTFVAGILAIAFLMNLLKRISFLPFVLYRVMLGAFLLVLLYG